MSKKQPDRQRADSVTMRIIASPFMLLGIILLSMLVSVLLELMGVLLWGKGEYWWWQGAGARHSATILQEEMNYLTNDMRKGLMSLPSLSEIGIDLSNQVYYYLFVWTGIESLLTSITAFQSFTEYVHAAINALQIFIIRLSIAILAIPLYALFFVWGFTEGLIRRDLRRFGGDNERAYVFHHVKRYAGLVITIPLVLYLALPISINPALIFPPTAIVFSVFVMATSATFIKQI